MTTIKRLRIFAGPNGSGKSTLVKVVNDLQVHLGVYVNADELKIELDSKEYLDFDPYFITLDLNHLKSSLIKSTFYLPSKSELLSEGLTIIKNCLYINQLVLEDNSFPLFLADYIRFQLVKHVISLHLKLSCPILQN